VCFFFFQAIPKFFLATSVISLIFFCPGRRGFNVLTADDGKKGMTLFNKNQVDLVITDIVMPEKEGIEIILELKKLLPDIPIIAISGGGRLAPDGYLKTAEQLGANYTFKKPFDRDDLLVTVYEALKDIET